MGSLEHLQESIRRVGENLRESADGPRRQLADGVAAIRVLGEFSAGKTRLIRELFGPMIPDALAPISSREVQTRLPLEVTWGEKPALQVVERASDYAQARALQTLDAFPERQDLSEWDPGKHRLRLFLPENRLTLATGDGYADDNEPKRLFLIDMPGWNSEDAANSPEDLGLDSDWQNLALVHVCSVTRADSQLNQDNLKLFVDALSYDMASIGGTLPLLYVVTHCDRSEREKWRRKIGERLDSLLPEDSPRKVLCVDFAESTEDEKVRFRNEFWDFVLSESPSDPIEAQSPGDALLQCWKREWDLRGYFRESFNAIRKAHDILEKARKDGKFFSGRSVLSLEPYGSEQGRERLLKWWLDQVAVRDPSRIAVDLPRIDDSHPARPWLEAYWIPHAAAAVEGVRSLVRVMTDKIATYSKNSVRDLDAWIGKDVEPYYEHAVTSMSPSFDTFCRTAEALPDDMPGLRHLLTLMTLSLIETQHRMRHGNG